MNGRLSLMTLATLIGCAATLPALVASPAGANTPAPTTCRGKDATIILIPDGGTVAGTPASGTTVITRSEAAFRAPTGTPGPDVVVLVDSAWSVSTGDGDDLVCVVGDDGSSRVSTGDGADIVDTIQRGATVVGFEQHDVVTSLGDGDDTFLGGPGRDWVSAGGGAGTITTGAGDDTLNTGPATYDGEADLGDGDDAFEYAGQVTTGGVDGGAGVNELRLMFQAPGSVIDIDAVLGTATVDGETTQIAGFSRFDFQGDPVNNTPAWASLRFRGSDDAEIVRVTPSFGGMNPDYALPTTYGAVAIDLGEGDDRLVHNAAVRGTMRGGAGQDTFATTYSWAPPSSLPRHLRVTGLEIDLARGRYGVSGNPVAPSALAGFEAVEVINTSRVTLVGSNRADDIYLRLASIFELSMGRGKDVVELGETRNCCNRAFRRQIDAGPGSDFVDATLATSRVIINGGSGPDGLVGGSGADVLDGGRGLDVADGLGGRDICAAERRTNCESRH